MQRKAPIDILVDATGGGRPPDRRRTLSRAIIGFLGFFFVIFLIYTVFPSSCTYSNPRDDPAGPFVRIQHPQISVKLLSIRIKRS